MKKKCITIGLCVFVAVIAVIILVVATPKYIFRNQLSRDEKGAIISELSVVFINAGRADSILIKANEKTYLIDTGVKKSYDKIRMVLEKYNVKKLDAVFLTHQHKDHIGGLKKIAKDYPIAKMYAANIAEKDEEGLSKIDRLAQKVNVPLEKLNFGDKVNLVDELYFDVLGPIVYNDRDDNDNSLVLKMKVNGKSFLFSGDMQFAEEETLMKKNVNVTADIYKISNHGNPDATLKKFAKKVSPEYAIVTTDTNIDRDSANKMVLSFFDKAKIYKTQDYELGVLIKVDENSIVTVRDA